MNDTQPPTTEAQSAKREAGTHPAEHSDDSQSVSRQANRAITRRIALKQLGAGVLGAGFLTQRASADELEAESGGITINVHIGQAGYPWDPLDEVPESLDGNKEGFNQIITGRRNAVNYIQQHLDYGDIVQLGGRYETNRHATYDESRMVKEVIRDLHGRGVLTDEDRVIVAHTNLKMGYGGGLTCIERDGNRYVGAAVNCNNFVKHWEIEQFTWHELGHTLGCSHADGGYHITYDPNKGDKRIDHISAMATGYVEDKYGRRDTRFAGTGEEPNEFAGAPDSKSADNYLHDISDRSGHHLKTYTKPSLNRIEKTITTLELPGYDC